MRKLLLPLFALVLFLGACSSPPPGGTPRPTPRSSSTALPGSIPCLVVNPAGSQGPALAAQFGDRGHAIGPEDAPVTLVVFSDYQCASCAYLAAVLKQIRDAHPADVRLIVLPFPLTANDKSVLAIQAAEAADLQGKFWEMHDLLFSRQADWTGLSPAAFPAWAQAQAAGLGMDAARFLADFQGAVVAQRAGQAVASTASIQQALPILFVNSSTPYNGRVDFTGLDQVVSLLALTRREFSSCPPMIIDPSKQYTATLQTEHGDIVVALNAGKAPLAVDNFVFLARSGWYDGNTFYRVLAGQLAATGDPSGTGLGNAGYFFTTELVPGLSFDRPGVVALSNTGMNSNASQFFITTAAAPALNGEYTIIGQVIAGLDVLAKLTPRDPVPGQALPPGDLLLHVSISER
jgi:cyclophilin family peptidyl-prolyl cis-trans isomerase/protein-disulfide isomerase